MRKTIKSTNELVIFFEVHPMEYSDQHSIKDQLNFLFSNGFICDSIISAGEAVPELYKRLGYYPSEIIKTDGVERGVYKLVKSEDAINLVTSIPKVTRYILLKKSKGDVLSKR